MRHVGNIMWCTSSCAFNWLAKKNVTCVVTKTYFSNTLSLTESIGKLGCVKELSRVRVGHD
jgi:hypothetical protein